MEKLTTNIGKKLQYVFLMIPAVLFAQETTTVTLPFTFSGSVDTYFRQNIGSSNRASDPSAPNTSFANDPGFALGMFNLIAGYEGEKVGFVADLVFGPRGEDAVFLSDGNSSIVNQLYVYWNATDKLKFTFGNFNTFLGYEVISPTANFNYSTSYMFSFGPFSHTGLKADYAVTDKFSVMAAVMNPTDYTEFNPDASYTFGAQLGYTEEKWTAFLNFLVGDQDGLLDPDADVVGDTSAGTTFQVDLTAGWDVTEKWYLGLNATYNTTESGQSFLPTGISETDGPSTDFYGSALYLQYKFSETFALGARGEYFKEFNGGVGAIGTYDSGGEADVYEVTLSGNYKIGGLTIIPEFRVDTASEDVFINADRSGLKPNLASFLLAAVYSF
ncbi:MAG: porin [Bacteroidetes bacterium]|nr:porin [Bacteroidota bacterium]